MSSSHCQGRDNPKKSLLSEGRNQTLLKRARLWLIKWQRSSRGATLSKLLEIPPVKGAGKTVLGEVSLWRHSGMNCPKGIPGAAAGHWCFSCCVLQELAARIWRWRSCLHSRSGHRKSCQYFRCWKNHSCCRSWRSSPHCRCLPEGRTGPGLSPSSCSVSPAPSTGNV